ncbi:hypothetical protein GX48_08116 [Paracoccidioides brasiliensis]|nr:hypothetical protein GX48_08116 [Paracoccidioides brasiliensis]
MNIEATKGDLTDLSRRAFELWQRLPVERTERQMEDGFAGERGRERVQKQWADPSEFKEANDVRWDFLGFGQAGEIRTTVRNDGCLSRLFSESKRWDIEIVEMVELVKVMETVSCAVEAEKKEKGRKKRTEEVGSKKNSRGATNRPERQENVGVYGMYGMNKMDGMFKYPNTTSEGRNITPISRGWGLGGGVGLIKTECVVNPTAAMLLIWPIVNPPIPWNSPVHPHPAAR